MEKCQNKFNDAGCGAPLLQEWLVHYETRQLTKTKKR